MGLGFVVACEAEDILWLNVAVPAPLFFLFVFGVGRLVLSLSLWPRSDVMDFSQPGSDP